MCERKSVDIEHDRLGNNETTHPHRAYNLHFVAFFYTLLYKVLIITNALTEFQKIEIIIQ